MPEFRVYLSSTVDDLQAERATAREIISKFGPVQDTYRADEKASTVANCLADVHKAYYSIADESVYALCDLARSSIARQFEPKARNRPPAAA